MTFSGINVTGQCDVSSNLKIKEFVNFSWIIFWIGITRFKMNTLFAKNRIGKMKVSQEARNHFFDIAHNSFVQSV